MLLNLSLLLLALLTRSLASKKKTTQLISSRKVIYKFVLRSRYTCLRPSSLLHQIQFNPNSIHGTALVSYVIRIWT
jgi:hypothetical protein